MLKSGKSPHIIHYERSFLSRSLQNNHQAKSLLNLHISMDLAEQKNHALSLCHIYSQSSVQMNNQTPSFNPPFLQLQVP